MQNSVTSDHGRPGGADCSRWHGACGLRQISWCGDGDVSAVPAAMMIPCDLLLDNVTIVTSDPRTPVIRDGAIAVAGSRLCFVGPAAEAGPLRPLRRLSMAGRVVTPGFVNVHTHAILSMVRGVAEDLGFAPAYTPGIPHGHDVTPEDAWALARLGALEALMFGSALINDSFVHAEVTV